MKLLVIPAGILAIISILGMFGLGDSGLTIGALQMNPGWTDGVYFDALGNAKVHYNLTSYGEPGQIVCPQYVYNLNVVSAFTIGALGVTESPVAGQAYWFNSSSSSFTFTYLISGISGTCYRDVYPLFTDASAENEAMFDKITVNGYTGAYGSTMDMNSTLGLVALVVGVMALAAVVGIHVLGSGISDEAVSAVIKGTAYLAIWGVFSVLGMSLIMEIPYVGVVIYFVLTFFYTFGIINSIGHPSSEGD